MIETKKDGGNILSLLTPIPPNIPFPLPIQPPLLPRLPNLLRQKTLIKPIRPLRKLLNNLLRSFPTRQDLKSLRSSYPW